MINVLIKIKQSRCFNYRHILHDKVFVHIDLKQHCENTLDSFSKKLLNFVNLLLILHKNKLGILHLHFWILMRLLNYTNLSVNMFR